MTFEPSPTHLETRFRFGQTPRWRRPIEGARHSASGIVLAALLCIGGPVWAHDPDTESSKGGSASASSTTAPGTTADHHTDAEEHEEPAGHAHLESVEHHHGPAPFLEIALSLGFIALLALATLWMMRRVSARAAPAADIERIGRDLADLRRAVEDLKHEVELLRTREHSQP